MKILHPTHAIICFNTKAGIKESGIHAMMKLCFGSDDDVINQILYMPPPGSKAPAWTLPIRSPSYSKLTFPFFTGRVGEEILVAVGQYSEHFKTFYKADVDGSKYGRNWRVTKNGIQEIKYEAGSKES